MEFELWLGVLLLAGPALGIGAVVADSRWGGEPISGRRLVLSAVVGGMVAIGAVGTLIAIVPEGNGEAIWLGLLAGGGAGAAVGMIAVWAWRWHTARHP